MFDNHTVSFFHREYKKMSETIDDMEAYSRLTDNIVFTILNSDKPELEESQRILNNIFTRKLYKFVCKTQVTHEKWEKEVGWLYCQFFCQLLIRNISLTAIRINGKLCYQWFGFGAANNFFPAEKKGQRFDVCHTEFE